MFQSSFELTGYITRRDLILVIKLPVSKLFRAYGLYNHTVVNLVYIADTFQSSFELTGYITEKCLVENDSILDVSKLFRAYGLYNLCSLEGA